jgi:hypothetical protein
MLYEWNSVEDFNTWHDALCLELGYPLIGINAATGLPDETKPMTTEYTRAIEVENKWIAEVEIQHAQGLTPTDLEIPKITLQ